VNTVIQVVTTGKASAIYDFTISNNTSPHKQESSLYIQTTPDTFSNTDVMIYNKITRHTKERTKFVDGIVDAVKIKLLGLHT
jgi:hypothetical protein